MTNFAHEDRSITYIPEVTDEGLGPAMLALAQMPRRFVKALILTGGENQRKAAIMAGYAPGSAASRGHTLAYDEKVQAAILEEGKKQMGAAAVLGTSILVDFMGNPMLSAKDRMRAIEMVFNRVGLPAVTEQKISVEHKMDEKQLIAGITNLAKQLGLDPQKLLGAPGVVDAEFVELPAPAEPETAPLADDLSDIL